MKRNKNNPIEMAINGKYTYIFLVKADELVVTLVDTSGDFSREATSFSNRSISL